jgi:hypothetical protein
MRQAALDNDATYQYQYRNNGHTEVWKYEPTDDGKVQRTVSLWDNENGRMETLSEHNGKRYKVLGTQPGTKRGV